MKLRGTVLCHRAERSDAAIPSMQRGGHRIAALLRSSP
jgi:hypothetical protein